MSDNEKPEALKRFDELSVEEKLALLEALSEQVYEALPEYSIAAQMLVHARILRNLQAKGLPEQMAQITKKKRR